MLLYKFFVGSAYTSKFTEKTTRLISSALYTAFFNTSLHCNRVNSSSFNFFADTFSVTEVMEF